ncbi:lytic transglycosylase domain-containing protein [Ancylomarina euxinus]|uniref:Lytic transglycosylase domain-containing protein n=1 Tax=Ancylomarina euxinus TaxID=2283627 RepID=A0A425Y5R8_9BACT|nr:lytic transglycosylase domain-containing protein [Ancylomarina euxinus]MCZ4694408.1 lytic transglycosylase domain-containing protein [Ancylomarina euxinus]MUP14262.1 transglycosylase SLT domain-containing protein [Ancylomarina euxinus]RRG23581.1 lytic transglycosylase domain-containing protein [Ancylomarina euxinus]
MLKNKTFKNISLTLILLTCGYFVAQLFNYSKLSDLDNEHLGTDYMDKYEVYALKTPNNLFFADEKVPLDRWDVKESLDRELLVNTYWQSQTLLFIKRANRYFPIIEPILKNEGVPDDFKYLALIESGLIPTVVSPAGAVGLWQFMPPTARDYKLEINKEVDERYNIEKSTQAACSYLKDSYEKFGSWALVAASYNAGRTHIHSQMKLQNAGSYYDLLLGEEPARYLFRIIATKFIMENPQDFGFRFRDSDLYPNIPTRKIKIKGEVKDFADLAKKNGLNYKILKLFNPWLRKPYLTNKSKKEYEITLPAKGYINFAFSEYKKPQEEEK